MSSLPACTSIPGSYPVILNSMEEDKWGMEKCIVLHFGDDNLRNGAQYALDRYRTLMGNYIWSDGIVCRQLWLPEVP